MLIQFHLVLMEGIWQVEVTITLLTYGKLEVGKLLKHWKVIAIGLIQSHLVLMESIWQVEVWIKPLRYGK